MRPRLVGLLTAAVWLGGASAAHAQAGEGERPAPVVEGSLGWAGFGDEGIVHHTLLGTGARFYVSRRFSLGPELQYMIGPDSDRDLILTGNVVFDVLGPTATRPRRSATWLPMASTSSWRWPRPRTSGSTSLSSSRAARSRSTPTTAATR